MKKKINFLLLLVSILLSGCKFFDDVTDTITDNYDSKITSVTFDKTTLNINVDDSDYIKLTLNPTTYQGKCNVYWEYDKEYLSVKQDNFGIVITGLKEGATFIKAKCNGIVATCLISVLSNGDDAANNPYIYSNYSVVELKPNNTTTISSSLYGGSIADMEMFEWSIADPAIATISSSRNNCVIQAHKPGSTQITCSHPNSEYDYTFILFVYTDLLNETYITTNHNVFTINKNDTISKMITVDLVNPLSATYKNEFTWNYADEKSKQIIQVNANLNEAEVIPLNNGVAKLKVSHKNARYDLDIIVRVNTIVKNTYIGLSESNLIITGSDTTYTVYASVENYDGYANPDKFVFEVPDSANDLMEFYSSGNSFSVIGKKNGSVKVKVSHELSELSRNLLIVLQEQMGSAIDASMYITTDQNYVQTKVGAAPTTINVRLVGGIDGEDNIGDETSNFTWWIDGGNSNGIVEVQTVTGVVNNLSSRSAVNSGSSALGQLVINPLKEGELKIVVSHPRCLYDTEIKLKVYAESALVNPLTITTEDSLIKLLNGESKTVSARLRNHKEGDENNIEWTSSNESSVQVSPSQGQVTQITACGTESSQTYVTAHLDGALSDKKILVLTANSQEELDAMKGIYADSTYLRISANETKNISVETFGLTNTDKISWTSSNSSIAIVSGDSSSENICSAKVIGVAEGKCSITASLDGAESVIFDVTVLKEGESSEIFDENAGYLTTNLNAVVIESVDESVNLSVSGVNIETADMELYTNWTMEDVGVTDENDSVFELVGSPGSSVTLTALKPGKSKIKVANKFSENSLTINAKCGELYEWTDGYIVYITTENDVVNIVNGASTTIGCALVNTTSVGSFSWEITQGDENIEIVGLASGTCNITAKQAGQAIITVSNSLAGEITKEILVNVANSEEELNGYKYLTTEQNVVTVGEQSNTSVTVNIQNGQNIISGYFWRSSNPAVCEVVGSGNVAVIYGKSIGSAKVIVENYENCDYPLEIIVNVVDPIAASEDPYISCNSIVSCTVGGDYATIAAELIGGTEADNTGFSWSVVNKSIATLYASNDSAQIKALKEGVTQVIISHPKASVDRSVLIICEPKITTNCYIDVTESIIKMSPSDESRTITATLVNGEADDSYDFKWWADSYEKINMNFTGGSCLIEPLASGVVNLHCSHPKAANQKDIVLYISKYSDFAFPQSYIELETGRGDVFLNMEVPATGVDCEISYTSDNPSLCNVWGNTSVCTLSPGVVTNNESDNNESDSKSNSCTITATLQTKGGVKQAEAQLLVSVTKKDETKPYIALTGNNSTIITLNKGAKRNLSAALFGTNLIDVNSDDLDWKINGEDKIIEFTTSKTTGKDVQIKALNAGRTTITITHKGKEAKNPLTLYVIVAGVSEPTISLNYVEFPIYIGEDTQTITASVQNAPDNYELDWYVENDIEPNVEQDFFTFTFKGNKASIYAKKPGEATVYCRLKDDHSVFASCKVKILEPEKIEFFVYDYEDNYGVDYDNRKKIYINSLNIFPGESKILHYETVPKNDTLKGELYRSDNSFFNVNNLGYVSSYTDAISKVTYSYPKEVGTVIVTGTTKEGTALLQATTVSLQTDSISITNSYNYLFTVDKSIVTSTPEDVHIDNSILYVNYEIRPACSKLYVTDISKYIEQSTNLYLEEGSYSECRDLNGRKCWIIDSHQETDETNSTGIVKGILKFKINGEINANIKLEAINENVVSSGNASAVPDTFSEQNLKLQVYYSKHSFVPSLEKIVPFQNHNHYASNARYGKSYFDESSKTFFLGDGEFLSGTMSVDKSQPYANVRINSVKFKANSSTEIKDKLDANDEDAKAQYDLVSGDITNSPESSKSKFELKHKRDYCGEMVCKGTGNKEERYYRLQNASDGPAENFNDTIKENSYVGNLEVEYYSVFNGSYNKYSFPVYVRVRNSPCAVIDDYYYFK